MTEPSPAGDAWQPISTAPKRGEVLVWHKGRTVQVTRHPEWHGGCYEEIAGGRLGFPVTPTHWRPLPPPPKEMRDE